MKIKFYAFRLNKGATGGPGGVLYLQKTLLGNVYRGVALESNFKPDKRRNNYSDAIKYVIKKELFSFGNYYIAHDIASAYALSLMGKRYSLVYHQQGPILEEALNMDFRFSAGFRKKLAHIERCAFMRAKSVHFPSKGAENMYFNNILASTKRNETQVGMPLPNTIEFMKWPEHKSTYLEGGKRFACIGSIQPAKGQDLMLEFMDVFLRKYDLPVHLTIAGAGVMENEIRVKADELKKKYLHFDYLMPGFVNHDDIKKILSESDIYIMLHRISIFDMATLEAMSMGLAVVLSDAGGNPEFNKENNVILVSGNDYAGAVEKLASADVNALGAKNKAVYEKFFSPKSFIENQYAFLDSILEQNK